MKDIYIIGAGGLAREVYFLINEINKHSRQYNFKGFVDYNPELDSITIVGNKFPVLKEADFLSQKENVAVVNGIGDPMILSKITTIYTKYEWPNLIHPNFVGLLSNITMEKGNIITAGNIFTVNIKIGSYNFFNLNCTIGHDTIIGDSNIINPGCNVSGGVKIGNGNLIGTNATILQYLKIGNNSVVGAASLVTKEVPNNQIHIGVPAKLFKEIT